MPSLPQPAVGPMGVVWTPIQQALQAHKQSLKNLAGQAQQGNVYDQWFNCVQVSASNLNQVVTIAAAFQQGGVEVTTGIANGTAGTAVQTSLAIGTLTVTKGSTSATLASTTHGSFATNSGDQIGAVDASGNNALTPGTTYTIVGSAVTLSQAALTSGTGLYCASCVFSIVT